jgi:unsaturated rhamnogalacturonyl hydrolase
MEKIFSIIFLLLVGYAKGQSWSARMAETSMTIWKDSFTLEGDKAAKWRYDQGVILKGIEGLWNTTGDKNYFNYIQKSMDFYVKDDGSIKGFRPDEYQLDHINNGKLLLLLYRVTGKEKYKKAVDQLRGQLRTQPRTSEGGFWHKKTYPYQMWLDGLYMAAPFYAEYAMLFHEDTAFNDITKQFVLMEQKARDAKTGLLLHGWDESKQQKWADPKTGLSKHVWGRAMGWYGMALVDALEFYPADHAGRKQLINILNRFAAAVSKYQDAKTGLWYDIIDKQTEKKNYVEASASSMFVYALAKGVRKGYLPATYSNNAKKGYDGIVKQFIKTENGQTNLHGTVSVSGLGGNPYRDGSFDYYMSEPVVVNDPKGVGAFINAGVEMEIAARPKIGTGKNIVLDYYFNNEWKKDATGRDVRYHYTWDDKANSGFSMLGEIFSYYGANRDTLTTAPTKTNLGNVSVYVIVDPDTEKETAKPNFVNDKDIAAIKDYVNNGGVLVLLSNDVGNAEFTHFNKLAETFGIHFNEDSKNRVQGTAFEQGAVVIPPTVNHVIFTHTKKAHIKEYSSLTLKKPAMSVLDNNGDKVVAVANYGKGKVFAVGDPWFYNEYIDGRKLTPDYDNYQAADDLVKWLLKNSKAKSKK